MMFKRFVLPLLAAFSLAAPAAAKPPVWVVKDGDSTIVIFGSVHMLPPGMDWRPAELDAALKVADDLWFELPLDGDSSREAVQIAMTKGMAPQGQTLSSKLSRSGRKRLAAAATRLKLDIKVLDRMQPWLADMTLGVHQLAGEGANGSDGVERTLSRAAPENAKRMAFETAADQILYFAEAPERDQLASLEGSLRELGKPKRSNAWADLLNAWMSGDLKAIEKQGLAPMRKKTPTLYRRLVTDRNARWTDAIVERLAGSGETVVVVGAAHLVGKDGLPTMLRKRGVSVEGP